MKYPGSKRRVAGKIIPIMLGNRRDGQWWVEPFVGGCNMIDKIDGLRMGNDSNQFLIDMFIAAQNGWLPPDEITREMRADIKKNRGKYGNPLFAFAGIAMSYTGKWWSGYAFDNSGGNHCARGKNNLISQIDKLQGVKFVSGDYRDMIIPDNSIIYCDPPYFGCETGFYKDKFDSVDFWKWATRKSQQGHDVYVSEYTAPADWECILEIETTSNVLKKRQDRVEKLFKLKRS